ncbi:MAG: hypothetical protein KatS3mg008_0780 [Acidimicrobiales bacterium]|nr:MAG: hypothetical protein KatS3mg008_0780 [Acidimicrobiales bacterium]
MKAKVGDRLVFHGNKVGQVPRKGTILEVRGDDGRPPYVVRWDGEPPDSEGHLIFPSSDAEIVEGEN